MSETDVPLLEVEQLEAVYEHVVIALRDVSLRVDEAGIVALLGANGAGKTTVLKAISRLLGASRGQISGGEIRLCGASILDWSPARLVRAGVVQVLEGRHCFEHLDVEENLIVGAGVRRLSRARLRSELERIYTWFPRLAERRRAQAGYLSGGEQQMVAIGRALMAAPRLVLLDEPSMGLAPIVAGDIFAIVARLSREAGVGFLLAEQNAALALAHADHAYVLENGRIARSGTAAALRAQDDIRTLYLGQGEAGRTSFREPPRERVHVDWRLRA